METYKIGDYEIRQWVVSLFKRDEIFPNAEYYYLINKLQGSESKFVAKGSIPINLPNADFKRLIAFRDAQIAKIVNVKIEDLKIPLPKCLQF